MGADSRKTFRIFSGFKLHTDKNDFGATIGGDKLSITTGTKGTSVNVGIPSTNIAVRKKISSKKQRNKTKKEISEEQDIIMGCTKFGGWIGGIFFLMSGNLLLAIVPAILLFIFSSIVVLTGQQNSKHEQK